MKKPNFIGLSHVCIIVDNLDFAVAYYQRILGAVPDHKLANWKNTGFFEAAGFVDDAASGEVSIAFLNVPGTAFTIELMEYINPIGRQEPMVFKANDISGARHIALKITNIDEAFAYIKSQPDITLINTTDKYKVYTISKTSPSSLYFYDADKEANKAAKQSTADILGGIKYFYFIDRYGVQWEFEQGHSDIGN